MDTAKHLQSLVKARKPVKRMYAIAAEADMSRTRLHRLCTGENELRELPVWQLVKLAEALDVAPAELLPEMAKAFRK
jgi:hypothetical protein